MKTHVRHLLIASLTTTLFAAGCSGTSAPPASTDSGADQAVGASGNAKGDRAGTSGDNNRRESFLKEARDRGMDADDPRTEGILALANRASMETLDSSEEVGLDVRAARNIVDYRRGPDGTADTGDDRTFETLATLDGIDWVSERAFGKLYAYAKQNGYVDSGASGDGDGDGQRDDNPETSDPADPVHGVAPGSAEAAGILHAANTADKWTLDASEQIGLDVRAATNIVEYRNGDDGRAGTDDDRTFETLTQLDGIAYVADRAFGKLAEWVEMHKRIVTLNADDSTVPALGDSHAWEGWLIVDGKPVSTGLFEATAGESTYHFVVDADRAKRAAKFVLTIEPADEPAGTPSASKYLAGGLNGGTADLSTTAGPTLAGADLTSASGNFFLAAPSAPADGETGYKNGIWFIDKTGGPSAGLNLPELGEGWTYEGWVVEKGVGPVSTGRFDKPAQRDSDSGGPFAGPNGTPPFPGQDFVMPDGRRDLTDGYKAVISVEPQPDNSPKPFAVKPLAADITDAGAKTHQALNLNDAGLPTAKVVLH